MPNNIGELGEVTVLLNVSQANPKLPPWWLQSGKAVRRKRTRNLLCQAAGPGSCGAPDWKFASASTAICTQSRQLFSYSCNISTPPTLGSISGRLSCSHL